MFLWAVDAPERLSARARRVIQDDANEVLVSAASAWEIAIKYALGDLELSDEPRRWVPDQMAANGFVPFPVLIPHALKVAELPPIHKDPFDRMLVAQVAVDELALITADSQVRRYDIRTIW